MSNERERCHLTNDPITTVLWCLFLKLWEYSSHLSGFLLKISSVAAILIFFFPRNSIKKTPHPKKSVSLPERKTWWMIQKPYLSDYSLRRFIDSKFLLNLLPWGFEQIFSNFFWNLELGDILSKMKKTLEII